MKGYNELNTFFIMAAPSCQGVYLIQSCNPRGKPIFKLGRSDDIKRRMKEYGPTWEILCCFPHEDSRGLEKFLIKRFETELKIYANNEYFETSHSASSIMKFFVDGVRFFTPAGPDSLSRPVEPPKLKKITDMKLVPIPPPAPKPVQKDPKLKIQGLNVMKKKPELTPLHRIKIHLINPEWPNMWKFSKSEFKQFVNTIVSQLKTGKVDSKYVKEQVWGFLDPMSVKKSEMNDICKAFESLTLNDITKKTIEELLQ